MRFRCAVVALALCGCGDKVRDLVKKEGQGLEAIRAQLVKQKFPDGAFETQVPKVPLDPKPQIGNPGGSGRGENAYVVSVEALAGGHPTFELLLDDTLQQWLKITSAEHPDDYALKQPVTLDVRVDLSKALAARYVVLYRLRGITDSAFDADLRAVDAKSGAPLGALTVHALTPETENRYLSGAAYVGRALQDQLGMQVWVQGRPPILPNEPAEPPPPMHPPPEPSAEELPLPEPWPGDDAAAPAVVSMDDDAKATIVRNLARAEELMKKHESPANACRSVMVLARITEGHGKTAEIRRVCVDAAGPVLMAGAVKRAQAAKKAKKPVTAACDEGRVYVPYAGDAQLKAYEAVCPVAEKCRVDMPEGEVDGLDGLSCAEAEQLAAKMRAAGFDAKVVHAPR